MKACDIANKQSGVPLPLWRQSASPTGAKEAEEHEHRGHITQGKHASSVLALGWYVTPLWGFCRFAAREIVTVDKAFQQRAFALKSVNAINERLQSIKAGHWAQSAQIKPSFFIPCSCGTCSKCSIPPQPDPDTSQEEFSLCVTTKSTPHKSPSRWAASVRAASA
jgi:hypothetical protein